MGKSPAKWIKAVLLGKKLSKNHLSKGREKYAVEREVVVAAKVPGSNFASIPPVSHSLPNSAERYEGKFGIENKEPEDIQGSEGVVLDGSQNTETQGVVLQDAANDPEQIKKEQAATIVQATFRGYLARRAFGALKGIIRLQALIRGHLVRRQAVATLCSMLGIVKFQALIRGKRVRTSDIGMEVQSKCRLVLSMDGKPVDPGVNISEQMTKLSTNDFIRKLLAPSPNVAPLYVHYESGEPNSAVSWLERWSSTNFWKPVSQPKKVVDIKSQKKQGNGQISESHANRSKRTRRLHSASAESVPVQTTSESEKPKRSFRKISSNPPEQVLENPQIELEKVKRNLRKVHNPVVENSVPSEADTETKASLEKELTSSAHDGLEKHISNSSERVKKEPTYQEKVRKEPTSNEKVKKETTSNEKVKKESTSNEKAKKETSPSEIVKRDTPSVVKVKKEIASVEKAKETPPILVDVEAVPEPIVTKEMSDLSSLDQLITEEKPPTDSTTSKNEIVLDDQVIVESQAFTESSTKDENGSATIGGSVLKDDLTGTENGKSGRKTSTPAKQERAENGLHSSPIIPSYMAATESAKAKLKAQGSPKLAQETVEKNNLNRRHSLPSSTKVNSQSPRTQRPVQSGGKGVNKSEKTPSSREGNGKATQAEWRR